MSDTATIVEETVETAAEAVCAETATEAICAGTETACNEEPASEDAPEADQAEATEV